MNTNETYSAHGYFVKNPLLPPVYRYIGFGIFCVGVVAAILLYADTQLFNHWILSVGWKCLVLFGATTIAVSREPNEDEVISRLRLEVAQWSVLLLTLITLVNIVISNDQPIESYKLLTLVLCGAIVLFRVRLIGFGRGE